MSETRADIAPTSFYLGVSVTRLKRTVRLGVKSLWLHRLRSLLTVLGIVFGVCSVIAMLAIGEGASFEAQEQIRQLGSNNVILQSVKPPEEERATATRTWLVDYGLKYADIRRIKATIPGVTIIVPARIVRKNVWNIDRRVDCDILGTIPWYPEMRNRQVALGRFFTDMEMEAKTNVCVLGASMVSELFPLDSPSGRTVRVGGDYYRVIGTMEPRGKRGKTESSQDSGAVTDDAQEGEGEGAAHQMYIPLTAARSRFGDTLVKRTSGSREVERVELNEVTVKVENREDVVEVAQIIDSILRRTHKKNDFTITVPLELLRQAEQTKRIFNIVLGSIAAISLLVGGIGIMNIMLASVTERTREIGIRRALGAKRRDIIIQFLVETVILSGMGGLIGVVLGVGIPFFITYFSNMKTIVTIWSPMIAFSISAMVGVMFGLYPASRAANMDPVEALRHE